MQEHGISRTEVHYRMEFAEAYPTKDEVLTVVSTCGSWTQITQGHRRNE